jgi:hypothetical protein
VLRAAFSSLLALLLSAVLMAGGCLPCQNLFTQPQAKSCCNNAGECEKPSRNTPEHKDCHVHAVDLQSDHIQKDLRASLDVQTVALAPEYVSQLTQRSSVLVTAVHPPDYSPPPLFLIHSSFLI